MGIEQCQLLAHPEYNMCCCGCKFRLRAFENLHPDTQIGWACIAFAFMEGEDVAYIGDFEHGGCELYTARNSQEKTYLPAEN